MLIYIQTLFTCWIFLEITVYIDFCLINCSILSSFPEIFFCMYFLLRVMPISLEVTFHQCLFSLIQIPCTLSDVPRNNHFLINSVYLNFSPFSANKIWHLPAHFCICFHTLWTDVPQSGQYWYNVIRLHLMWNYSADQVAQIQTLLWLKFWKFLE